MKKILAITMASMVLAVSLAGCGKKEAAQDTLDTDVESVEAQVEEEAPAEEEAQEQEEQLTELSGEELISIYYDQDQEFEGSGYEDVLVSEMDMTGYPSTTTVDTEGGSYTVMTIPEEYTLYNPLDGFTLVDSRKNVNNVAYSIYENAAEEYNGTYYVTRAYQFLGTPEKAGIDLENLTLASRDKSEPVVTLEEMELSEGDFVNDYQIYADDVSVSVEIEDDAYFVFKVSFALRPSVQDESMFEAFKGFAMDMADDVLLNADGTHVF